jgi:hypothetical protein
MEKTIEKILFKTSSLVTEARKRHFIEYPLTSYREKVVSQVSKAFQRNQQSSLGILRNPS